MRHPLLASLGWSALTISIGLSSQTPPAATGAPLETVLRQAPELTQLTWANNSRRRSHRGTGRREILSRGPAPLT